MSMQTEVQSQAIGALTQIEVQVLADKIISEILDLGQKSISKKKVVEMVVDELQKLGVINRGDASLEAGGRRSCTPDL